MNTLKIKLLPKKHPYPSEPESSFEAWGIILVEIHSVDHLRVLKQIEWDVLNFAEWFANNKEQIASEEFLVLGEKAMPDESLSEALHRIRLHKFLHPQDLPDNALDQLSFEYEGYYQRHSLLTEMGGSGMAEILIGLNNGIGEISLLSKTESWKYQFDMDAFITDFTKEVMKFISNSLESMQNEHARKRSLDILHKLQNPPAF